MKNLILAVVILTLFTPLAFSQETPPDPPASAVVLPDGLTSVDGGAFTKASNNDHIFIFHTYEDLTREKLSRDGKAIAISGCEDRGLTDVGKNLCNSLMAIPDVKQVITARRSITVIKFILVTEEEITPKLISAFEKVMKKE